jgi:hypothetical protein
LEDLPPFTGFAFAAVGFATSGASSDAVVVLCTAGRAERLMAGFGAGFAVGIAFSSATGAAAAGAVVGAAATGVGAAGVGAAATGVGVAGVGVAAAVGATGWAIG